MGMIETESRHAKEGIIKEIKKWNFVPIDIEARKYFENDILFGQETYDLFSDSRADIKDAGNCIAIGLGTAAVFHLMRVAEHGLRGLSKKVKVRLVYSGKHHPIEYADWQKVISGIQSILDAARKLPPGTKKQERLELFSDAADHCVFMKDIWRNNISHARKPYTVTEAIAVMERVRDFMKFLAVSIIASRGAPQK